MQTGTTSPIIIKVFNPEDPQLFPFDLKGQVNPAVFKDNGVSAFLLHRAEPEVYVASSATATQSYPMEKDFDEALEIKKQFQVVAENFGYTGSQRNNFSLADVFYDGDNPIHEAIKGGVFNSQMRTDDRVFPQDKEGILLAAVQMQQFAQQYSDRKITYQLLLNPAETVKESLFSKKPKNSAEELHHFFKKNRQFIPNNVTLEVYLAGKPLTPMPPILGTGKPVGNVKIYGQMVSANFRLQKGVQSALATAYENAATSAASSASAAATDSKSTEPPPVVGTPPVKAVKRLPPTDFPPPPPAVSPSPRSASSASVSAAERAPAPLPPGVQPPFPGTVLRSPQGASASAKASAEKVLEEGGGCMPMQAPLQAPPLVLNQDSARSAAAASGDQGYARLDRKSGSLNPSQTSGPSQSSHYSRLDKLNRQEMQSSADAQPPQYVNVPPVVERSLAPLPLPAAAASAQGSPSATPFLERVSRSASTGGQRIFPGSLPTASYEPTTQKDLPPGYGSIDNYKRNKETSKNADTQQAQDKSKRHPMAPKGSGKGVYDEVSDDEAPSP